MTVALLGIGADSTNSEPAPPVYPDGRFEYIPIPEKCGSTGTTETRTYGNTALRHQDRSMADYLDVIRPRPGADEETELDGEALAAWPLHFDPNFEALTYGETTSRGAYTTLLRELDPGDGVAFYTGLRGDGERYRHRYVIGYFTVSEILDCREVGPEEQSFESLSADERAALMDRHSENAHAKRFRATGRLANGDGLVIVDGTDPGGLLDRAVPISTRRRGGHYYLTDELQDAFDPAPGGNPDRNAYLGGIKPAHELNISVERFREIVT